MLVMYSRLNLSLGKSNYRVMSSIIKHQAHLQQNNIQYTGASICK